ncbi:O-linked N-acetylglucosamine transferase family protein [Variovorax sp. DT-64]|uniref:O-linked N-acetylglucosamine transferase, SPINDLY family protein n=1 Tax=Variovorax sp. DT-64 TaxID=3396160 RepID=UPI003F19F4EC
MLSSVINYLRRGRATSSGSVSPRQPVQTSTAAASDASAFRLQGNAAIRDQKFAEAADLYKKSIAADVTHPSGHIGLGFALVQLGDFEAAIGPLLAATALDPQSADGFYMLGKAHAELGAIGAAETAWTTAHALAPGLEEIYCDFCLLLFNQGKADRAQALIEEGILNYPQNADFHFYLGNLLAERADYAAAVVAYQRAAALAPDSPHFLSNLGNSLMQIGRIEEAVGSIGKAFSLAPDEAPVLSNYLLCIQYSTQLSAKEKFEAHLEFSRRFETPLRANWGGYENDLSPQRKLKIGYVSGDFRNHSLAFFIEPILKNHDRLKFEIYCYYSHPVHDEVSERIRKLADHWTNCTVASDDDLAQKIRADRIDILIDLSGHTGRNRLLTFARKPAPVQMTWLGYQASTGLSAIDFRITEESLDPTGTSEIFHSERLLRLPSSGTFSPSPDSPPVNGLPVLEGSPFTFACLNNPSKISNEIVLLWAEILRRSPGSRLMIGNSTPNFADLLAAKFRAHGVDESRVMFQPKVSLKEYLELHHRIDLALDTFPYNGGTTTFHSLWMGVPIVARHGDTALSKVGAAAMHGLGFPDFCADTKKDYVEKALYFFSHPEKLVDVRQALRENMASVTSALAIQVTASLEGALRKCWAEYCQNPAKVPLEVES